MAGSSNPGLARVVSGDTKRFIPQWADWQYEEIEKQKTPWGAKRSTLLVINLWVLVVSSSVYTGWGGLSAMLYKSGAYAWICPVDGNGVLIDDRRLEGFLYVCDAQDARIGAFFNITLAAQCAVSIIAGYMADKHGPRTTTSVGIAMQVLGWVLLAFSSQSFQAYTIAFLLIGASCDFCYLPCLGVSNLFPRMTALILSMCGAGASLSFGWPPILQAITESIAGDDTSYALAMRWVLSGWVLICLLPALVLVGLFYPWKPYRHIDGTRLDPELAQARSGAASGKLTGQSMGAALSVDQETPSAKIDGKVEVSAGTTANASGGLTPAEDGAPDRDPSGARSGAPEQTSSGAAAKSGGLDKALSGAAAKAAPRAEIGVTFEGGAVPLGERVTAESKDLGGLRPELGVTAEGGLQQADARSLGRTFKAAAFSVDFVLICLVHAPLVTLGMSYYMVAASAGRLIETAVARTMLGVMLPLSFLPCVALGWVSDRFGVMHVIALSNLMGIFAFSFALSGALVMEVLSVLCYTAYISVVAAQFFFFIHHTFASSCHGKLCGLCMTVAGLFSLVAVPLYSRVTLDLCDGDTKPMALAFTLVLIIQYASIAHVWMRNPKTTVNDLTPSPSIIAPTHMIPVENSL